MLTPYLSALKDQLQLTAEMDADQRALLQELELLDGDNIFARRIEELSASKTSGGQIPHKNRCKCCNKPLP